MYFDVYKLGIFVGEILWIFIGNTKGFWGGCPYAKTFFSGFSCFSLPGYSRGQKSGVRQKKKEQAYEATFLAGYPAAIPAFLTLKTPAARSEKPE